MGYLIVGILLKRKIKTGRLYMKITDKNFTMEMGEFFGFVNNK